MTTLVANYTSVYARIAGLFSNIADAVNKAEPVPHWVDYLSPSDK